MSPREVLREIVVLLLPPGELQEMMLRRLNKSNVFIKKSFIEFGN
jgi:hypothetical protein